MGVQGKRRGSREKEEGEQRKECSFPKDVHSLIPTQSFSISESYHPQLTATFLFSPKLVESADNVIPEHLTIVINRNNEYRRLVDKSAEKLLKQGKFSNIFLWSS